ncbi:MAG: GH32 C-terminal domain-containing protein [Duncaniella sp.]|nr:GH32 C-terminal domain-containing protein [Duncaniella sp.]
MMIVAAAAAGAAMAADGIRIDHLGPNNTLVRVEKTDRYLLLPIQDSAEDSRIDVIVDGKVEKTLYARLARNKVDFSVPLDLAPYGDRKVLLSVTSPHSRASVREAQDDAAWKNITLSDTFDTSDREHKWRPAYHATPLYGWMNDPNGMFYKDGRWHLYYQWNPYGSKWQNMTWGHSSSTDLIHWDHHPTAIEPDALGSIFSGSSVVDHTGSAGFGNGAVVALYTSAADTQQQSLASSTDGGMTFDIFDGNPVITRSTEARDPNMFWHEPTGKWVLLLAHALEHEMLVYTSTDLKNWTYESSFGKGEGAQDGVWECPDLFPLKVDGDGAEKWMLICNLNPGGIHGGSATQYFTGDFDGKTFTPDRDAEGKVATKWMDYGKDHYATVSWSDAPDGRRTVIGWMSNWQYATEVPTMQFRSANTLPREVGIFTGPDGQLYASSAPSPELLALRGKPSVKNASAGLSSTPRTFRLPADGLCEITLDINAQKSKQVDLVLSNTKGEKATMSYHPETQTFSLDRTLSGVTDFSENFPAVTASPTFSDKNTVSLRIFIDRSSIEVFGDGGRFAMTNIVFPNEPYTTLSLSSKGGNARASAINVYPISAGE